MQKIKPEKHVPSPRSHTFPALPSSRTNTEARPPTEPLPTPQVTEQKKQPAKPHNKLGWRFLLNGQTQAALAAYRQAIRHNPQSANAYLGLGMTLKSIGKVGMAKKAFLKAVDLDPRFPSALVHLGYLYAEGHFGQPQTQTALKLFRQASELGDPFAPIALLDMKSRSKI